MKKKSQSGNIGACGEHYVCAYLSAVGLSVGLPRGGNLGTDLFVAQQQGGIPIGMQVKTGKSDSRRNTKWLPGPIFLWPTSTSIIESHYVNLWYAFVWLNDWPSGDSQPKIFFVPSADVVECMKGVREEYAGKPESWTCFWFAVKDSEKYEGLVGLKPLLSALSPVSHRTIADPVSD